MKRHTLEEFDEVLDYFNGITGLVYNIYENYKKLISLKDTDFNKLERDVMVSINIFERMIERAEENVSEEHPYGIITEEDFKEKEIIIVDTRGMIDERAVPRYHVTLESYFGSIGNMERFGDSITVLYDLTYALYVVFLINRLISAISNGQPSLESDYMMEKIKYPEELKGYNVGIKFFTSNEVSEIVDNLKVTIKKINESSKLKEIAENYYVNLLKEFPVRGDLSVHKNQAEKYSMDNLRNAIYKASEAFRYNHMFVANHEGALKRLADSFIDHHIKVLCGQAISSVIFKAMQLKDPDNATRDSDGHSVARKLATGFFEAIGTTFEDQMKRYDDIVKGKDVSLPKDLDIGSGFKKRGW